LTAYARSLLLGLTSSLGLPLRALASAEQALAAQPKSVLPENSFAIEDVLAYGHTVDPMDLINCFVL
jgi:hypothetical protein